MPTRPKTHVSLGRAADIEFRKQAQRFYASAAWRRLREWYLNNNPLCCECQRLGRAEAATCVDHIQSRRMRPDLELSEDNLRGYCRGHHTAKTNRYDR